MLAGTGRLGTCQWTVFPGRMVHSDGGRGQIQFFNALGNLVALCCTSYCCPYCNCLLSSAPRLSLEPGSDFPSAPPSPAQISPQPLPPGLRGNLCRATATTLDHHFDHVVIRVTVSPPLYTRRAHIFKEPNILQGAHLQGTHCSLPHLQGTPGSRPCPRHPHIVMAHHRLRWCTIASVPKQHHPR